MPSFDPSQKHDTLALERVSHEASSHQSLDWLRCQPISTPLSLTCHKNKWCIEHWNGFSLKNMNPETWKLENWNAQLFEPQLMTNKNHFPPSPLKWVNMWWRAWGGRTGTTRGLWRIAITIIRFTITIQWDPAKPALRRSRPVCHFSVSWAKIPNSTDSETKVAFHGFWCTALTSLWPSGFWKVNAGR